MPRKIYPITAEHLHRVLSDEKVNKNIRRLGRVGCSAEQVFGILQMIYSSRYIVGNVPRGTYSDSILGTTAFNFARDYLEGDDSYFLFHFHSHPSGDIAPSVVSDYGPLGDLLSLADCRRDYREENALEVKRIDGIVTSKDGSYIDVLLVQEDSRLPISEVLLLDLKDMFDHLYQPEPQNVVNVLEETGLYKALALRMEKGKPLEVGVEALRKFEFTPQKLK